jgi:hypothetical protein
MSKEGTRHLLALCVRIVGDSSGCRHAGGHRKSGGALSSVVREGPGKKLVVRLKMSGCEVWELGSAVSGVVRVQASQWLAVAHRIFGPALKVKPTAKMDRDR